MKNLLKILFGKNITITRGKAEISNTREVSTPLIRETNDKLIVDSIVCPYCASKNFIKRGWRIKKLEKVQLLICNDCKKTFTPQSVKGKHYPLATIFDAISLYNLGYSLEESCRRVNMNQQKTTLSDGSLLGNNSSELVPNLSSRTIVTDNHDSVKMGMDPRGTAPLLPNLTSSEPHLSGPIPEPAYQHLINPSTLSNWIEQFKDNLPFLRMRDFAIQKYKPADMIITATLAHRQLYRFRFHRAKCSLVMQENFHHRTFTPLVEFLEMVPGECPHQYFQQGLRASEAPLTFSKTAMIVRGKTNYATKLAAFVLQGAKERKDRHEILQKFMLYNDSVTVATEVPVYLTRDDLEHMKTQLGFEIYIKSAEGQAAATADATPVAIEHEFFEEQIGSLSTCRWKVMHLARSWEKFSQQNND